MEELKLYLNDIVCVTCLASDRELQHLKDIQQIQELLPDLQLDINENRICWECSTTMRKFVKFRQKASEAQKMFTKFLEGQLTSIKSFSNLKWEQMVDGVKIVMEDQSSRIQIQSDENDELMKETEDFENNYINNTLYEEVQYKDVIDDDNYSTDGGSIRNRLNSQTELSSQCEDDPMEYQDENDDDILQKLPVNFEIDDEETNKIIENTLEAFLQDLKVKKENNLVATAEVSESDHGVNENEDSFIALQSNHKVFDVPRGKILNPYKNVSRKKISREEMEEMLDRERENNCYKNAYFKCEKCVYGYDNVNQYTDHLEKHDEKQGLECCTICEQRFADRKTAMEHYQHHFMAFHCTVCGYTSRFLRFLKAHQDKNECRSKKYPIWFFCDECDQKFALESLLGHHKKTIHQVKYTCKYCTKTFAKDSNRKLHEQLHKGIQCDICKKSFMNKKSFQHHLKNVHDFTAKKIRQLESMHTEEEE